MNIKSEATYFCHITKVFSMIAIYTKNTSGRYAVRKEDARFFDYTAPVYSTSQICFLSFPINSSLSENTSSNDLQHIRRYITGRNPDKVTHRYEDPL